MILSKARVYLTDQGWTGKGKEQAQIHFYPFLTHLWYNGERNYLSAWRGKISCYKDGHLFWKKNILEQKIHEKKDEINGTE